MILFCPKHGWQSGMVVSKDVVSDDGQISGTVPIIVIDFVYLDSCAARFYVSPAVAGQLGFDGDTSIPLADDFPAWTDDEIWSAVCVECFQECRGLHPA
jgi:hypothetical protein